MAGTTEKDQNRVAGGLKATIKNPNTSEDAKDSARERLEGMGVEAGSDGKPVDKANPLTSEENGANHGNVMGGYKAALNNPRVSEEAKEHAREVLEDNDEI